MTRILLRWLVGVIVLTLGVSEPAAGAAAAEERRVLDAFDSIEAWSAHPADGVGLKLASDTGVSGKALRMDFRFTGGGYAVARRKVDLTLPANYALAFKVRGVGKPNVLEFKLIDESGENVWWYVRRNFEFPADWKALVTKKRQISFAWGPLGGGEPTRIAAVEIVVTAGQGGSGSLWVDDFEIRSLPVVDEVPPEPVAVVSSSEPEHPPTAALDTTPSTAWRARESDKTPWFGLDLGRPREFGGLTVDWAPDHAARDYDVEASDDGTQWLKLLAVRGSNGGRDYLYLPESEARWVRVRATKSVKGGMGIQRVDLRPLDWGATRETFFQAIAREMPRGSYPRGLLGEQTYWTVVGADYDPREVLFGEEGAIEVGRGEFSLEPFVLVDGRLVSWADVRLETSLVPGTALPETRWVSPELELTIAPIGAGRPDSSAALVRYTLTNRRAGELKGTFYLAVRPFQVNPVQQFLNTPGGTAPIAKLALTAGGATVEGALRVQCLTPAARFGALTFAGGDIVTDYLRGGRLPETAAVTDEFRAASGAFAWPVQLAAGASRTVDVRIPLHTAAPAPPTRPADATRWFEETRATALEEWRSVRRATITLPEPAARVAATLDAQLGYILINRAGPAIQPGVRSYARSWIRDGALTSSALIRLGYPEAARAFAEWFAPHQFANGKIPCVVDARGADPVPEHDSSGEFIFLVAEYYRYTKDRAFVEALWPRVRNAVAFLDSLRQDTKTAAYDAADRRHFRGLLPPSISHEGYSAKPMHSYWDDFWAVQGFRDAVFLAGELGLADEVGRIGAQRDAFTTDFRASIVATQKKHKITYIPGCADLGDFDATSTTMALSPVDARDVVPKGALEATFQRYYDWMKKRSAEKTWDVYTPYEARNIGAFVRLGWRDRAAELVDFLLETGQRPAGWLQWAEVVGREERTPRFIGDMPHTWCGSDFVRSILDMLVYDRASDQSLLLASGIPARWLPAGDTLRVADLPTPYGPLGYTLVSGPKRVEMRIEAGVTVPPGGLVVTPPLPKGVRTATIDGAKTVVSKSGTVTVRTVPAVVVFGKP